MFGVLIVSVEGLISLLKKDTLIFHSLYTTAKEQKVNDEHKIWSELVRPCLHCGTKA